MSEPQKDRIDRDDKISQPASRPAIQNQVIPTYPANWQAWKIDQQPTQACCCCRLASRWKMADELAEFVNKKNSRVTSEVWIHSNWLDWHDKLMNKSYVCKCMHRNAVFAIANTLMRKKVYPRCLTTRIICNGNFAPSVVNYIFP